VQRQRVSRRMSTPRRLQHVPTFTPTGQRMYRFSRRVVEQRQARERFGSYSMAATLAKRRLVALPIDDPQPLLVAPPVRVVIGRTRCGAGGLERGGERLLRVVLVISENRATSSGGVGAVACRFERHRLLPSKSWMRRLP